MKIRIRLPRLSPLTIEWIEVAAITLLTWCAAVHFILSITNLE
jgi:hypothetical protein